VKVEEKEFLDHMAPWISGFGRDLFGAVPTKHTRTQEYDCRYYKPPPLTVDSGWFSEYGESGRDSLSDSRATTAMHSINATRKNCLLGKTRRLCDGLHSSKSISRAHTTASSKIKLPAERLEY